MKIVYYVHDLSFPLREGVRKQAWWLATEMRARGHDVSIVSTSSRRETIIHEGIPIMYGSCFSISSVDADVLHYISHPTPLILPLLLRARAPKQFMTLFDGALNGFWKRPWHYFLSWLFKRKVTAVTLQTAYQAKLFDNLGLGIPIIHISPLFPQLARVGRKSKNPSLLFMSHLHPNKGIRETLAAYDLLRKKNPTLTLTIADSGITQHHSMISQIRHRYGHSIIIKKTVNPSEELSRAWVYLYPITSAQETFSVPLSLVEAIQVKTPWVSCDVGGLREYFDERYLVPPSDSRSLAACISQLLRKRTVGKFKAKIDNHTVIRKFLELYHGKR